MSKDYIGLGGAAGLKLGRMESISLCVRFECRVQVSGHCFIEITIVLLIQGAMGK